MNLDALAQVYHLINNVKGGLAGLGGYQNPYDDGRYRADGGAGLYQDIPTQFDPVETNEDPSWFEKYFTSGESKDMSGYGQAKDMSQFASIPSLFGMSNQMARQQRPRQIGVIPNHQYIRSLLGD